MTTRALYVRLESKPGREQEIEALLRDARSWALDEPETAAWFAIRIRPSTFAIFDAFDGASGRDAHLGGKIAAALKERASDLFANQLDIVEVEVIADKLPASDKTRR